MLDPDVKNGLWARRGRRLMSAAASLGMLVLAAVGGLVSHAGEPSDSPSPDVAEQVMAELRAAGAARAELLAEEQQWRLQKEQLQVLGDSVKRAAEGLRAKADDLEEETSALQQKVRELEAVRDELKQVEAVLDTLASRLEEALLELSRQALPGLVPPWRAEALTGPGERLAAAVARLDQAEQQTRKAGVELVTGWLAGEPRTVKLLRVGGVAAWWMALDRGQAGNAVMQEGRLVLRAATTAEDAEAIAKAFSVVEGRAPPDWLMLPLKGVQAR